MRSNAYLGTFSADGKTILCEGTDGSLLFFDRDTGRFTRRLQGPAPFALFVQTPDGRSLITADFGVDAEVARLRLWDLGSGKVTKEITDGTFRALMTDGRILVVNSLASKNHTTGFEAYRIADGARLWQNSDRREMLAGWISDSEIAVVNYGSYPRAFSKMEVATGRIRPADPPKTPMGKPPFTSLVPESPFMARVDSPGILLVMDLWTWKPVTRIETAHSPFGDGAVSPDGKRVALTDGHAPGLHLFDIASRREISRPVGHLGPVNALAFTPDERSLISAGRDGLAFVWDVRTGAARHAVRVRDGRHGHQPPPSLAASGLRICFPYDRNIGGWTDTFEIWDLATEARVKSQPLKGSFFGKTLLSPDGKTLANRWFNPGTSSANASVADWTVRISDVATEKTLRSIDHPNNESQRFDNGVFAFTSDGRLVFGPLYLQSINGNPPAQEWDGTITIWDFTNGKTVCRYRTPFTSATPTANGTALVGAVSTSRELELAAFGRNWESFGEIVEVELATGHERARIGRQKGVLYQVLGAQRDTYAITQFVPSYDGRLIAELRLGERDVYGWAPGNSKTMVLWDAATGKELHQFASPMAVTALAFAPDGRTLASGGADGTILIWDVAAHRPPPVALAADEIARCWTTLASADAAEAFRAMCRLADDPAAMAKVGTRLRPVPAVPAEQLAGWVRDLENDQFAVRQRAAAGLRRAGRQAEAVLREAAQKGTSAETRRQAATILADVTDQIPTGERLADLRAVELLEWWGTPEARATLADLSRGAAGAEMTVVATAALKRLEGR
jgi:WD40 repeat protein